MRLDKQTIFCDSAEPKSIQFLKSKDIRAKGANKGRNSVKAGITYIQNHTIIVHPKCKNMIKELENFVFLKDKATGQLTEKTDHDFSHLIDALRYAYSDIYNSRSVRSQKLMLGL